MGLELVQLRPSLYIGDTADGSGLDNMVAELVANALAEAPTCNSVAVSLHDGDVVSVCDNGPGLPIDTDSEWDVPLCELVATQLHAGGHFGTRIDRPKILYGVGLAVINALSEEFVVRIWRRSLEYVMRFYLGAFVHRLQCTGAAGNLKGLPRRGTEIAFSPSPRFFADTCYDFDRLERRLRLFESVRCGVTVTLTDRRGSSEQEVTFEA